LTGKLIVFCHEDTRAQSFFVYKVTKLLFQADLADLADIFKLVWKNQPNLRKKKSAKKKIFAPLCLRGNILRIENK